jgi:predicted permease
MLTRMRALPGAGAVGGINALPLAGSGANGMFLVLERPDEVRSFADWNRLSKAPGRSGYAEYRVATPGYFEAMEIPLARGRLFDESDGAGPLHAALVSASLAETQWPGEDPLGKLIQFGNMDGVLYPFTVVGVVGDVRSRSLDAEPQPMLYGNAFQRTSMLGGGFDVVVAADGRPASLIPGARDIVRDVTPEGPARFRTLDEIFSASLAERRFSLLLLGVFGVTALLLAAMGIYGVISYTVAQRTREIGIRMALGAERGNLLRLIVREGLVLTLVGLAAGLGIAYAATRVLASQLYGVGALDPLTFLGVGLLLTLAAAAASYVPARRATGVDPMTAFRAE